MSDKGSVPDRLNDAARMLDAFGSVGVATYDVTVTTLLAEKITFRRAMSASVFRRVLPVQLEQAEAKQHNIIVRPHSDAVYLVQCDDISRENVLKIRDLCVLTLCTSPNNYQAWFAITPDALNRDTARRLKIGLKADLAASGATRIVGSYNFKEKYMPSCPLVRCVVVNSARIVSTADLEHYGVLAGATRYQARGENRGARRWPSYEMCLQGAPTNGDGSGVDVSRADWVWCMTAASWGWAEQDIAAELQRVSDKARERGERYAVLTAAKASAATKQ